MRAQRLVYILKEFRKLIMIFQNVKNNPNLIRQFLFLKNKNHILLIFNQLIT